MIGLPKFAMVLSEMLLRSKGEATVHGSVRSCNGCFRLYLHEDKLISSKLNQSLVEEFPFAHFAAMY